LDNSPPRGTRDLLPDQVSRREEVIAGLVGCYERFGFRRVETPAIEDIARLAGDQGGENEKLIYRVLKRGLDPVIAEATPVDELVDLGLRFDLTVPLTRFYANNQGQLPSPFRAMQIGPVWRAERPQKGRYRQFTQCDIDTIGETSVLAESELLEATLTALAAMGVRPVEVRLNDRRLLAAVAGTAGVGGEATGAYFVTLDKLDKIGWEGVKSELAGRGYGQAVAAETERIVGLLASADDPAALLDRAADLLPSLDAGVLEGLRQTAASLTRLDGESELDFSWSLDPTVVRGMGYYTGQIFEIAHAEAAGSVAGGGRYDGLVGRSLGREVPACGISIGFERVIDLAEVGRKDLGVAVLYGSGEPIEEVLAAARRLRATGRPAGLVPRRSNTGAQLGELAAEGYSAFVTVDSGSTSEERSLTPEGSS
jgi:histidyl-tRNA synthetase